MVGRWGGCRYNQKLYVGEEANLLIYVNKIDLAKALKMHMLPERQKF